MDIINHYTQVGIVVTDNLSLKKFCECHLENIFSSEVFYDECKLNDKIYKIAFKDKVGIINKFCSIIFNKPFHGPCIVYIKDVDLTEQDCMYLLHLFKESNK